MSLAGCVTLRLASRAATALVFLAVAVEPTTDTPGDIFEAINAGQPISIEVRARRVSSAQKSIQ